jgi:high-affinity iron transporter
VELALFLAAAAFSSSGPQTAPGALLGLGTAALLGWALFASTLRLNLRRFFQVTGVLLVFFAAGLVAHSLNEFNQLGWVPSVIGHIWNINRILNDQSTFGQVMATLFGYNASPSLTEALAYAGYFGIVIGVLWARQRRRPKPDGVSGHAVQRQA